MTSPSNEENKKSSSLVLAQVRILSRAFYKVKWPDGTLDSSLGIKPEFSQNFSNYKRYSIEYISSKIYIKKFLSHNNNSF